MPHFKHYKLEVDGDVSIIIHHSEDQRYQWQHTRTDGSKVSDGDASFSRRSHEGRH